MRNLKKKKKKTGPKPQDYKLNIQISEKVLSEIEIIRLEKFLTAMLVKAEEEGSHEHKPESSHLLQSFVG